FQAEDGIRDFHVTGVQTCALPISMVALTAAPMVVTTTNQTISRARRNTMPRQPRPARVAPTTAPAMFASVYSETRPNRQELIHRDRKSVVQGKKGEPAHGRSMHKK